MVFLLQCIKVVYLVIAEKTQKNLEYDGQPEKEDTEVCKTFS